MRVKIDTLKEKASASVIFAMNYILTIPVFYASLSTKKNS